jgi:hypothetical protein
VHMCTSSFGAMKRRVHMCTSRFGVTEDDVNA